MELDKSLKNLVDAGLKCSNDISNGGNPRLVINFSKDNIQYIREIMGEISDINDTKYSVSCSDGSNKISIYLDNVNNEDLFTRINDACKSVTNYGGVSTKILNSDIETLFETVNKIVESKNNGAFAYAKHNGTIQYKIFPKTNEELMSLLRSNGYDINEKGCCIFNNGILLTELLKKLDSKNNKFGNDNKEEQAGVQKEQPEKKDLNGNVIEVGESTVDFYEKMIKDANGRDLRVRINIVSQNSKEDKYERYVSLTYLDKDDQIVGVSPTFGYKDASQFENDVLPNLISGFTKNYGLAGMSVYQDESDVLYVRGSNGNGMVIAGDSVEKAKSILGYSKEVSDGAHVTDNPELTEKVGEGGSTTEELVTGQNFNEEYADSNEEYADSNTMGNKKITKTIGTHPLYSNNTSGNASFDTLLVVSCLLIDIISIVVGVYLLLN